MIPPLYSKNNFSKNNFGINIFTIVDFIIKKNIVQVCLLKIKQLLRTLRFIWNAHFNDSSFYQRHNMRLDSISNRIQTEIFTDFLTRPWCFTEINQSFIFRFFQSVITASKFIKFYDETSTFLQKLRLWQVVFLHCPSDCRYSGIAVFCNF